MCEQMSLYRYLLRASHLVDRFILSFFLLSSTLSFAPVLLLTRIAICETFLVGLYLTIVSTPYQQEEHTVYQYRKSFKKRFYHAPSLNLKANLRIACCIDLTKK